MLPPGQAGKLWPWSQHTDTHSCGEPWARALEDGDVVVNLGAVALGNALSNPYNVATLLFLELHIGIEDTKVELVQEGQLVQFHLWNRGRHGVQVAMTTGSGLSHHPSLTGRPSTHLMFKESVLQGLVSRVAACTLKKQLVLLAQGSGGKHEHEGTVGCGVGIQVAISPPLGPAARALTG